VTYEQVETALHEQAILSGYRLDVTPLVDTTKIYVSVGVPVETITAEGVPDLPAHPGDPCTPTGRRLRLRSR